MGQASDMLAPKPCTPGFHCPKYSSEHHCCLAATPSRHLRRALLQKSPSQRLGCLTALCCPTAPVQFRTLRDDTLAYQFDYPVATTQGQQLPLVFSRRPEKYSSAAPLTADARYALLTGPSASRVGCKGGLDSPTLGLGLLAFTTAWWTWVEKWHWAYRGKWPVRRGDDPLVPNLVRWHALLLWRILEYGEGMGGKVY